MADSVIQRNVPFQWHYEYGLILKAIEGVWQKTRHAKYFAYIMASITPFIDAQGNITTYTIEEYNLDQVRPGAALFPLYRVTGDERYKKAAGLIREQLRGHPRTSEKGFWHKKIYPYQMWLDGIYMASPFYAEYGKTFDEPENFDDVAHQIILVEKHTRDPQTGLLYHAWDESKQQRWANPETGCSPHFWSRAIGWYAMAIVDVLDDLPADHPRRDQIIAIFARMVPALAKVQDQPTGLWYQVLDQGHRAGNYLEASGSCMFVYAIAKAVRMGYLAPEYREVARKAFRGILGNLIEIDERGLVNLTRTCGGAGLGGNPYRDGSYEYYIGEKIVTNDYKGVGPFILASLEMETI
ncbi:MAG: glycoside hydrolase family 88 protein [Chloroflexi bacterium]|nr:glycoside hydrolase family 88 protein [Chloroflexota bacterium]